MINSKLKILVVDDSLTNITLLEGILEDAGYDVITAPSALEAIKIMSNELPDLLLLDLMMPRISGFKLLEKMKKDEKLKKIIVVVVSAKKDEQSIKLAYTLGAIDFIKKPIDIQNFIERIRNVLSKSRAESD